MIDWETIASYRPISAEFIFKQMNMGINWIESKFRNKKK